MVAENRRGGTLGFHAAPARSRTGPGEFWSVHRLQFATALSRPMVAAIREVVAPLDAREGEILSAVYTSSSRDFVDTENVLFYNVGAAAFARAARNGVRFIRRFEQCSPGPGGAAVEHHHSYELITPDVPPPGIRRGPPLASWRNASTPALNEQAKPAAVWFGVRRSDVRADWSGQPQYFGLDVIVHSGRGGSTNTVAFIKPLVDGIVAAFHWYDGAQLAEVSGVLGQALGIQASEVAAQLSDRRIAVLGARRLVWPHGRGIQWNPADDTCVMVQVVRSGMSDSEEWTHSGELYEVLAN